MRIIHTSDWHIGKKLEGKTRLPEQSAALSELYRAAAEADLMIVAGDVFDTSVPPAEAEETFFEYALKIASRCPVIVAAGNHDDEDRLCAPRGIARACDITLSFAGGESIKKEDKFGGMLTGEGGRLCYEKNGETLNLAVLPYPRERALSLLPGESYEQGVKRRLAELSSHFEPLNPSVFDMTVSHLFIKGGSATDESSLGAAQMLPLSVLPNADYTALGHIHKPMAVSKNQNVIYSGSILGYAFGEDNQKSFCLIDTRKKSFERIPLSAGKPLLSGEAARFAEAERFLSDNANAYCFLTYTGGPLSSAEFAALKSQPGFCKFRIENKSAPQIIEGRAHRSPQELFAAFYKETFGEAPDGKLAEEFSELFSAKEEGEN